MMTKEQAPRYSMDLSHVAAVELPVKVRNTDKAISMLGGTERIRVAVNSRYKQQPTVASSHSVDDRTLELRLRNDPFHHPIQALSDHREKILVKVSIPKSKLPKNYYESSASYTIRDLISESNKKPGASHKVEPVAIINKSFSFRAIADFQMSTKNNATVQTFKDLVLNSTKFEETSKYYTDTLVVEDEFKDGKLYKNIDHNLIPPPYFSGVRFPFDYRYQKNPFTVTLRDESGEARVVMKKDSKKLFTNTVDFNTNNIPDKPLPEIISKYKLLLDPNLNRDYADTKLVECVQFLTDLFEVKPIWLRKLLMDVVPEHLNSVVKEALPYVFLLLQERGLGDSVTSSLE